MSRVLVVMMAAALLASCKGEALPSATAVATSGSQSTAASVSDGRRATASALATGGGASSVKESTDLYEFDYSYPAAAGRIPALKAWLDAQRTKARAELIENAKEGRATAKENGFEYRAYASGRAWDRVTETPRFLSLSAQLYDDGGGAHPNHGTDSLLFDKRAGERLAPLDLFVSKAAFDAVIQKPFCALLDIERSKRRGEPVISDGSMFNDCIRPSEQTVILGSSHGRTFDKVGVLVGPYAAGPYAEGDYEFTLPVSAALLKAVKPEYRGEFSAN